MLSRWHQIDILINNAGISDSTPALELTDETWQRMIGVNLTGVFVCSQVVGLHMVERGYGRIVNISSTSSQFGAPGLTAYAATKNGVLGLTRVMAVEWGSHGRDRQCHLSRQYRYGLLARRARRSGSQPRECLRTRSSGTSSTGHQPAGWVEPVDIAAMAVFLASPATAFVTGQVINVCGGPDHEPVITPWSHVAVATM